MRAAASKKRKGYPAALEALPQCASPMNINAHEARLSRVDLPERGVDALVRASEHYYNDESRWNASFGEWRARLSRYDPEVDMATTVETALGPIATTELGPTLMHEHIVTRSPGVHENWPHLFDRDAILAIAERKMADLYGRGIRAIVDLTTVDLGRDIDLIVAVARRSRVRVIAATGVWWMPQRYFSSHGVDAVAELFVRDITRGVGT